MEKFGPTFLAAAVVTFFLGFILQGVLPVVTLGSIPVKTVEEVAGQPTAEFVQLAQDYPQEFSKSFGEPNGAAHIKAVQQGRDIYIAEACWHCHSQFIRPVSNEDLRFGPVSTPEEAQDLMNLPHLYGTRRVGPDLSREAGKRSNDWHLAHFYEPRNVSPYSVMPAYPWFFDDNKRPTDRALALVAYMQWLGSNGPQGSPSTIYDMGAK